MLAKTKIRGLPKVMPIAVGTVLMLLALATPGEAAVTDIASSGPLTNIWVSDTLSCQVKHINDNAYQFYSPGAIESWCGTYLYVEGNAFGPVSGLYNSDYFTPIGQSSVTGSGTSADPYRLVTEVAAGSTGIRLVQTDTYVVGTGTYRTDVDIHNDGGARSFKFYRIADCYLGGSDSGYGATDISGPGAIACTTTAHNSPPDRMEEFQPLTSGSSYHHGRYYEAFQKMTQGETFGNSCVCDSRIDNGAGLSWPLSIGAGASMTVSSQINFDVPPQSDNDGDGIDDVFDNCYSDANPGQEDADGDGAGDACDADDDNDGVLDGDDNCRTVANADQANSDGDSLGDACDNCDPRDNEDQADSNHDGIGDACDVQDEDGDGVEDDEDNCPQTANADQADNYGTSAGDACEDTDGDGVNDSEDAFPLDASESGDNDGDGIGDNADTDDDNDGQSDNDEATCGSDPLDATSTSPDNDGDGSPDCVDSDDDNDGLSDDEEDALGTDPFNGDTDGDGTGDAEDAFPLDETEWADNDSDGIGDNADTDDDNDGQSDSDEVTCGSDPLDATSTSPDNDGDGSPDCVDPDDDNDGFNDGDDAFPFDETEWADNDSDGIGDNADTDDDNDGQSDSDEVTCGSDPLDATSTSPDNDGDGSPDCVDTDDDNDGVSDEDEIAQGSDPFDADSDDDGCDDGTEAEYGSDPNDPDTDGDLHADCWEIRRGADPNNPLSFPLRGAYPLVGPVEVTNSTEGEELPITDEYNPLFKGPGYGGGLPGAILRYPGEM